jgi:hypothetical protein
MKIMVINVLAIGDTANVMKSLSKITKKSKIHIVNFPKDGAGNFIHDDNVDRFLSWKVKEQVEYINKIKNNFDICIVMGTGERIAYLADLNYIVYYVGRDIDAPRFIKNSKEQWFTTPLHKLNFLERKFYHDSFKNALEHVAGRWVYPFLKKFDKNGIRMDMMYVDSTIFSDRKKMLKQEKTKFTFFCPQRMGIPKGTNLLWESLKFCKSNFEIIQVNWFDESNEEELKIKEELLKQIPSQVKLVPMIKRNDMVNYYNFVDAIIGNMYGNTELVELEGITCKKPVLQYQNKKMTMIIKNKEIVPPFYPFSNNPKEIAKAIDRTVESEEFREHLVTQQSEFIKDFSDPIFIGEWWDNIFEKKSNETQSIKKNSSKTSIKFRMLLFLIGNRLYWKKIRKFIKI